MRIKPPAINSLPQIWVPKRPPINAPVVVPIRLPSPLAFTGNEETILDVEPKIKEKDRLLTGTRIILNYEQEMLKKVWEITKQLSEEKFPKKITII